MRSASRSALCLALVAQLAAVSLRADALVLVHQQRYSMGTMFDILVYHASRDEANRAITRALAEIVRLDQVMSHYRADSNLSTLHRDGAKGFVAVDPSLYEVVEESLWFSRLSGGRFDVTIAPLLTTWKEAAVEGRRPSEAETSKAAKCVGFDTAEQTAEKAAQYATHIQRLEDRVQVLERIVTDRGYDIATQIEALRDTRRVDEGSTGIPLSLEKRERV